MSDVDIAEDTVQDVETETAQEVAEPAEPARSKREQALDNEVHALLASGQGEVWDRLMHRFESRLIRAALGTTHGRRMEAAQRLGIGRNTITRKIQELGLDAPDDISDFESFLVNEEFKSFILELDKADERFGKILEMGVVFQKVC